MSKLQTYKPFSCATSRFVSLPSFKAADRDQADLIAKEMWIKDFAQGCDDPEYKEAQHIIGLEL